MGIAAYAQFLGRNYEEAMRLCARGICANAADFVGAHRVLTAAAGMAGQTDVAKRSPGRMPPRAAQYFARLDRRHMPIRHDADREHYLEGFRRAGLE